MNLAIPSQLALIPCQAASKWDYARAQEAKRILHDRSRIAAAVADVIPDGEAAWGFMLLHAAEVMSQHGDDSLKEMLNIAANNAALYSEINP